MTAVRILAEEITFCSLPRSTMSDTGDSSNVVEAISKQQEELELERFIAMLKEYDERLSRLEDFMNGFMHKAG